MLQIEGVSKQFSTRVLLTEANAHLRQGSRVGLVGPNGAGKTTLMRMILGEDSPTRAGSASVRTCAWGTWRKSWKP